MPSFVSHKFKLIFCHIPRTGGTSFFEAIRPHLGEKDDITSLEQHTPLKALKVGRIGKVFDEYTKLAIVREPFDRMESLKANRDIVDPIWFGYQGKPYWEDDWYWLCDDEGNVLVDVVLRFEELPQCAINFLRSIGIECESFPHLNKRGE